MGTLKLLFVIFVFSVISLPCFAERKIEMIGDWDGRKKTIPQELPIKASIEDSSKELSLQFSENLGPVNVTVMHASGEVVYNQIVETGSLSSFVIHLNFIEEGECTLSITDGVNEVRGEIVVY